MWFEQMHPGWQLGLADWRHWLTGVEGSLASRAGLAPEPSLVMAAFAQDPNSIRVVILGQDPYPTHGVAVGRSFAVSPSNNALPASLRNIFRELADDVGGATPNPNLIGWQEQGVLMLNRHLTTLEGQPGAHFDVGWQKFTDAALEVLLQRGIPLVLVLWGAQAQLVKSTLAKPLASASGLVSLVESPHPSPLSAYRGFFGSKPFSLVNSKLIQLGAQPIDWNR